MSWLVDWWAQSCADRRAMLWPDNSNSVPAYPWLPDGTPSEIDGTPFPLAFFNAVLQRLPVVMNLDALRRSVMDALAGKPDTRTHYERSRAAWREYLKAKELYLGNSNQDGPGRTTEGPGHVEEAQQEAEAREAATGSGEAPARS